MDSPPNLSKIMASPRQNCNRNDFCWNYLRKPSLTTYQKARKKEAREIMLICNPKWPLLPIFWL